MGRVRNGEFDQDLAPTARQVIELWLSEQDNLARVLAGGKPGAESCQGMSGPLRPGIEVRGPQITVMVPTQAGWESTRRYHLWCRKHGYPCGELLGVHRPEQPPRPSNERTAVRVTWPQVRAWAEASVHGEQLALGV